MLWGHHYPYTKTRPSGKPGWRSEPTRPVKCNGAGGGRCGCFARVLSGDGRGAAPAAQGVMGTTPDPRASLAVRAPPVLASVQGQGSEAAAVRVRKEEWARGKHKEGKVQVAARRPQLQAPCGSGPKIKSGQFFSEGRRIIFIPWCGGRLPLGSKIEVNGSI